MLFCLGIYDLFYIVFKYLFDDSGRITADDLPYCFYYLAKIRISDNKMVLINII